jgi:hypothetical protein
MLDSKRPEIDPIAPDADRRPSDAKVAAVVEAAYILEAVRR